MTKATDIIRKKIAEAEVEAAEAWVAKDYERGFGVNYHLTRLRQILKLIEGDEG